MKKAIIIIGIIFAAITAKAQTISQTVDTLTIWDVTGTCVDTAYMVTYDSVYTTLEVHFEPCGVYYLWNGYSLSDAQKVEKVVWTGEEEKDSRRSTVFGKTLYLHRNSKSSNHEDIHHHLERNRNL